MKSWCETILGVIVIVFALWESIYMSVGKWVLLIAGIILVIHSMSCRGCFHTHMEDKMQTTTMKKAKRKR